MQLSTLYRRVSLTISTCTARMVSLEGIQFGFIQLYTSAIGWFSPKV